jgi:hypothetical protein
MTATSTSMQGMVVTKEEVCLSGVADALGWRQVLERNDYVLRPECTRFLVYPDFLSKLGLVVTTRNLGMDPDDKNWRAYESIILECESFAICPIMGPESDPRQTKWTETKGRSEEWMEEAKTVRINGRGQDS